MTAARRLFAAHGYAATPAQDIVAAANVTRGALYHHYGGKLGLFRVVLEQLESELTERVRAEIAGEADVWTAAVRGLTAYFDVCQQPEVVRIALTDAPAVLGWAAWREVEAAHGLGLITESLRSAVDAGILAPQPVEPLAQLVLSAIIEAALMITYAEDTAAAREQAQRALLSLLGGILTPSGG